MGGPGQHEGAHDEAEPGGPVGTGEGPAVAEHDPELPIFREPARIAADDELVIHLVRAHDVAGRVLVPPGRTSHPRVRARVILSGPASALAGRWPDVSEEWEHLCARPCTHSVNIAKSNEACNFAVGSGATGRALARREARGARRDRRIPQR